MIRFNWERNVEKQRWGLTAVWGSRYIAVKFDEDGPEIHDVVDAINKMLKVYEKDDKR